MPDFDDIYDATIALRGEEEVTSRLNVPASENELRGMPDREYFSMMSKRIFRAGLRHSMVDSKWPEFEKVFYGFDINLVRMMSHDELEALMKNERIIRHWGKIRAVRENAQTMYEIIEESGSFGSFIAAWKDTEIVDLWSRLAKMFKQLGGNSAPYFLRMIGKDTFLLTNDVVRSLNYWGVWEGNAKSMSAKQEIQLNFNRWKAQSGRPLCQLSQVLALSVE